jgi:hypothetical protein
MLKFQYQIVMTVMKQGQTSIAVASGPSEHVTIINYILTISRNIRQLS